MVMVASCFLDCERLPRDSFAIYIYIYIYICSYFLLPFGDFVAVRLFFFFFLHASAIHFLRMGLFWGI